MAYLPAERIAFQADLFDTHEPPPAAPTPAMRSLFNQVQRMKLDVATLAPVHGEPVPWSDVRRRRWADSTAARSRCADQRFARVRQDARNASMVGLTVAWS